MPSLLYYSAVILLLCNLKYFSHQHLEKVHRCRALHYKLPLKTTFLLVTLPRNAVMDQGTAASSEVS